MAKDEGEAANLGLVALAKIILLFFIKMLLRSATHNNSFLCFTSLIFLV